MVHLPKACQVRQTLALVFALLPMACITANVSVPEVEVTRENLTFQGVPADMPTEVPENTPPEIRERYGLPPPGEDYHFPSQRFTYERISVDMPTGMTSDMRIREVTIRAHEGSVGLSFIRGLRLTAIDPTDPLDEAQVLLQYPAPGETPPPLYRSLTMPFQGSSAAIDPWNGDTSVYTLDVWADLAELPHQTWAVDVVLVVSGDVEFEF